MKYTWLPVILFLINASIQAQSWTFTPLADMPEPISNNSVVAAEVNGKQYVYSFNGIDSTKTAAGIHNRCWRYDVAADAWEALPDLPDPMTKIATGASVINGIAYVFGGYHVFVNGSELTRELVHRLDLSTNTWLSDGAPTPVPVDDHVQGIWQDSLIYLVTGWSGTQTSGTNVASVQIYNPAEDNWTVATGVPSSSAYKVFGASGVILGDTIYYFGGAKILGSNFLSSTDLRIGVIDPNDPANISWSFESLNFPGYRTAATILNNQLYWLGGSDVTYNYNGIAYNGSGGVPPNQASLVYDPNLNNFKRATDFPAMPMDLRGVGEINPTQRILAGGMEAGQKVSKQTWLLTWEENDILPVEELEKNESFRTFPNPLKLGENLQIEILEEQKNAELKIYDVLGKVVFAERNLTLGKKSLDWRAERVGLYFLEIGNFTKKILIQ